MSEGRATPGKARLVWGVLALGLVFCAVYVARQELEPSRSTQKPKTQTPTDNHPSKTHTDSDDADSGHAQDDPDERDAGEQDADYLASATPALSDPLYHSDPLHDDEVVPHPITEERIQMAKQHALFEHITESLKLKDFRLADKLINQHEMQFGSGDGNEDGWEADRRGYALLLDCLEPRSEYAREQAEDFIEQERLSPLRRHVRRVCLDGHDF